MYAANLAWLDAYIMMSKQTMREAGKDLPKSIGKRNNRDLSAAHDSTNRDFPVALSFLQHHSTREFQVKAIHAIPHRALET